MKKTHIIGIVIIAVAVAVIFSSLLDSSTYANFDEAFSHPGKEYHVVGKLDRASTVIYNPEQDPNLTEFTLIDKNGEHKLVKLEKAKPQDFERSQNVVLIGKAGKDAFYANDILMKCPSKYKDQTKFDSNSAKASL